MFELKEKSYKSSSLLPGKIGVRNASETTTELLKYPELPGPWTPAVRDLALRASHTKMMEYCHFQSTEFFPCFFIITRSHACIKHKVVCFQMLDFETSNSKLEVWKSNSWKITSFSKTTSLQREPFHTMFYTINLSPLLVTK